MNLKLNFMTEKLFKKLKKDDIKIIKNFIDDNIDTDKNSFELKLNRFFLDKKDKPKNWLLILEILSNHNSAK